MSRMSKSRNLILSSMLAAVSMGAQAQATPTTGTLVVVPAYGEVKHINDQVRMKFTVEEQDKDKATAASKVNLKMKQGTEILKRQDPSAILQTHGYYTYPIYPEEPVQPRSNNNNANKLRQPTGWRVGQYLDATTNNLDNLPKTVAAVQSVLGLNGINFSLSPATAKKLDDQRIAATYQNLTERIASIARAMGRSPSDGVVDTIDFEGSGNYAEAVSAPRMMMSAKFASDSSSSVAEPSFEPGETTLTMRAVGRVRFSK